MARTLVKAATFLGVATLAVGAPTPAPTEADASHWPGQEFGLPRTSNPACIPVERVDWAREYRKLMMQREPLKDARVVFLGDSITMLWRTQQGYEGGTKVWEQFYKPLGAANLGIAADRTEHILWRITQDGELNGINPKVLVLMVGVNNLLGWGGRTGGDSPANTAEAISVMVNQLKVQLPQTKILLLGILPCMGQPVHPVRERIKRTNAILAGFADQKQVFYLDFGDRFLEPDGTIVKEKLRDMLHPSEKGYLIWAEAMQPYLEDLLNNGGTGAIWKRAPIPPNASLINNQPNRRI